ncbi:dynamin, putative [Theileria equi strain WA]|uniref:Dynamin, putative n=1 Tax=Theileria equi strain WA TaxID=1537102 RepID=L0B1M3_THEEQ|nr:dynamin, putative [Theileria equi strain WA]AFZ81151.1 dynamin, putative [Theileria equi strain WA]|eukprot:XP_004830817.1 dynamin, putative [Theileria equi strain WA]
MSLDMNSNLRQLISLVDNLRDIGLHKYINLPRICVAGTQSSGKSSVLESIVGIDFLPRGDGIVTRRPIEFRLNRLTDIAEDGTKPKPYIVFEGNDEKFYDFERARSYIQDLTNQRAGTNKGIVDDPIVLSVYSPDCPDLSLIDLPGVTRVPLKNSDQTDDIEMLTKEMIMRYASDPRTIILAVVAANVDMSTSDALQLARRADPQGIRTLGVITKIDLMDRGASAYSMLQNDEVPLRLGYTGVKNRSQQDIAEGVTIEEALKREHAFFSEHKIYRNLNPSLWGVGSLVNKLTNVLLRHISTVLPELKAEILNRIKITEDKLSHLGTGAPIDSKERLELLWMMITEYCDMFNGTIRGKYVAGLHDLLDKDIVSSVQIRTVYNELLENLINQNVFDKLSDVEIDQAIRIHEGDSLPGFPSPDSFEYLMLPQLQTLKAPIFECLDKVYQTLELLSVRVAEHIFGRFPALCDVVLTLSQKIFMEEKENTKICLSRYVESETSYIFTNDAKYMTETTEDKVEPQKSGYYIADKASQITNSTASVISGTIDAFKGRKTRYNAQFIQEIRKRLNSYFAIVLRNVRDTVPKVIGHFLVRKVQRTMQHKIYTDINQQGDLSSLFGEPPHITQNRETLREQLSVLTRALNIIQRDFSNVHKSAEIFDKSFDNDLKNLSINSQSQESYHSPSIQPVNNISYGGKNMSSQPSIVQGSAVYGNPGMQSPKIMPGSFNANPNIIRHKNHDISKRLVSTNPLFD